MLTLLLAASLSAQAQDYAVQWSAEPVQYHTETLIQTPRGQTYFGTENVEGRALALGFTLDVECTGKPAGKATNVDCLVNEAAFEGQAMNTDEERLPIVMAEYARTMKGTTIQMVVGPNGRIRSLDLEGPEKGWWREARVHEVLRQLTRRAFTPLDIQAPKDGAATDKQWKYKGFPMAFELMSKTGTAGGVVLKYRVEPDVAGRKMLVAEGRGNVASNADIDAANSSGASGTASVNMVGAVQVLIDPSNHQVAYGEFSVNGQLSSQSVNAVGDLGYLNYAGWVGRVNADGTMESLEGPKAQ